MSSPLDFLRDPDLRRAIRSELSPDEQLELARAENTWLVLTAKAAQASLAKAGHSVPQESIDLKRTAVKTLTQWLDREFVEYTTEELHRLAAILHRPAPDTADLKPAFGAALNRAFAQADRQAAELASNEQNVALVCISLTCRKEGMPEREGPTPVTDLADFICRTELSPSAFEEIATQLPRLHNRKTALSLGSALYGSRPLPTTHY